MIKYPKMIKYMDNYLLESKWNKKFKKYNHISLT